MEIKLGDAIYTWKRFLIYAARDRQSEHFKTKSRQMPAFADPPEGQEEVLLKFFINGCRKIQLAPS